ncbi:hypothetical protein PTKIN_Ptkin09bG0189300 [Pterospermum kingtungense]
MGTSLHEDGLISKTKFMVLSLSGIISKSSRLYSPMKIREGQCTASAYKQPGLKTLTPQSTPQTETTPTHQENPLIIHSYTTPQSSLVSSSDSDTQSLFRSLSTHSSSFSSWSSGMDDMLGTESGVYMSPNGFKIPETDHHKPNGYNHGKSKRGPAMTRSEFPPPIPLLSRTGNLPCYMPWILRRHYRNGRLVLVEEKRKHHEYFEAYREDGRLILDLVSLDDTFKCCHAVRHKIDEEETELESLQVLQGDGLEKIEEYDEETEDDDDNHEDNNGNVYRGSIPIPLAFSVPKFYHGNERYGDPRKCLTYSGRILSEASTTTISSHAAKEEGNSAPFSFYDIISSMTPAQLPVM